MINNFYQDYHLLTDNQKWFIKLATQKNLKVIQYSGKYAYGQTCPAVIIGPWDDVNFPCHTESERLGDKKIIYATI